MQKFILENLQRLIACGVWLDYIELPIQSTLNTYIGGAMTEHTANHLDFGTPVWWSGYDLPTTSAVYVGSFMTIQARMDFSI